MDDNQESKTEQQLSKNNKNYSTQNQKNRGILSAGESLTETTPRFHVILSNIRGKGSFDKR